MNKGHWNKLRHPYDHRPQQKLTWRKLRTQESIEQDGREIEKVIQTQKVPIDPIRRVELIGQKELHGREGTGGEVPQQVDQHNRVDGTMLQQSPYISKKVRAFGTRVVIGVTEDGARFPEAEHAERCGEGEDHEKDLA